MGSSKCAGVAAGGVDSGRPGANNALLRHGSTRTPASASFGPVGCLPGGTKSQIRSSGGASQEQVQRSQRQVSVWIHLQGGGEWQGEERHLCAASRGGGRRRRRGK